MVLCPEIYTPAPFMWENPTPTPPPAFLTISTNQIRSSDQCEACRAKNNLFEWEPPPHDLEECHYPPLTHHLDLWKEINPKFAPIVNDGLWEQGWRSGENTCLPPMMPGFKSQQWLLGWVCCWFSALLWEVFLWVLWFSSLLKTNFSKFQFDQEILDEQPLCGCPTRLSLRGKGKGFSPATMDVVHRYFHKKIKENRTKLRNP